MQNHRRGFTLVELLIVIVVIAILASITLVVYNGVAATARDAAVKTAAKQLVDALRLYSIDNKKTPLQTGGGWSGEGIGWVSSGINDSYYPLAIETVLVNGGYLPYGFTSTIPKNKLYNSSAYTLMLYGCGTRSYVVYFSLEAPTSADVTAFNNVKTQCSNAAQVQTDYNMQGGYIFQ